MSEDLDLVSTDDLLKELSSRFDSIVFGGSVYLRKGNGGLRRYYNGAYLTCAGLCDTLKYIIMRDYEEALAKKFEGSKE